MSFYNTTQEAPEQVQMFTEHNQNQNEMVLKIANRLQTFSASKIYKRYPTANTPITSIRRAINTLFKENKIDVTGNRVQGIYGRSELEYKVI